MSRRLVFRFLTAGFALVHVLVAAGCGREDAVLPERSLEIGGRRVKVEVAATPEARTRGLQGRARLGENEGMLFVFPEPTQGAFWMRGVPIPLSIAFINADGYILSIQEMVPDGGEKRYRSPLPYRFALEMNRGWFAAAGVRVGDRLNLDGIEPGGQ